jgi:hypothetical protein
MKKISIIGVLLFTLTLSGCRDFLDINQNPNYPEDAPLEQMFPAALIHSSVYLGNDMMLLGGFFAQHFCHSASTNQYNSERDFNLLYSNRHFSDGWIRYYAYSIPAYMEIVDKAEAQGVEYLNYKAMAEIMIAYDLHILNSTFDKVAIYEGFTGENENPTFQEGKDVYNKILARIEAVLNYDMSALTDASDLNNPGASDYVFGGNVEAWMKFANTFYLKMLMRDFEANRSTIIEVLADSKEIGFLNEDSGDAAVAVFEDAPSKSNPLYEMDRRQLNTPQNIRACERIVTPMVNVGDPRRTNLFDALSGANPLVGGVYGTGAANASASRISLGATDPVYFSTVAESYFLQAEAYARLDQNTEAKTNYDLGVAAAFDRFGHDATTFTAVGGAYEFTATTIETQIEQIMFQKWLASIRSMSWDAWMDQLRTGYPQRGKAVGEGWDGNYSGVLNAGLYPVRFLYPQRSSDYNPNTPEVVPISEKMWWHKQ